MTIRSERVKSHSSELIPAASAARAMNPKWRVVAKLWTCSTQIPVRVETSESVKIFWLDFTVTMALLLGSGPNFRSHFLGCYKHPICFYETRAIVVPFRPQKPSG